MNNEEKILEVIKELNNTNMVCSSKTLAKEMNLPVELIANQLLVLEKKRKITMVKGRPSKQTGTYGQALEYILIKAT